MPLLLPLKPSKSAVSMTPFQLDGKDNKFLEESSRDQTPVLMMTPSSRRRPDSDSTILIWLRRRLSKSMVTLHFMIPLNLDGLVNKLRDKNSRDQTQALMMIPFSGKDLTRLPLRKNTRCTKMRDTEFEYS